MSNRSHRVARTRTAGEQRCDITGERPSGSCPWEHVSAFATDKDRRRHLGPFVAFLQGDPCPCHPGEGVNGYGAFPPSEPRP